MRGLGLVFWDDTKYDTKVLNSLTRHDDTVPFFPISRSHW